MPVVVETTHTSAPRAEVSGARRGTAGLDHARRILWEDAEDAQVQSAWRKEKPGREQSVPEAQ